MTRRVHDEPQQRAGIGLVYLVVLVATRELSRADLRAVLDLRKQK